jgi:transcriptional regulator with XRE-family HTH domain
MNYGKALRIARAVSGVQQQELAERAGLTASYVSLVEMGKRNPSVGAINKLSRALQIPPHLLTILATEPEDTDLVDTKELESLGESLVRLLLRKPTDERSIEARKRKARKET